ncbi:MAG: thymidine phosphorylase [Spirochaetales bacterium]|jgi:pyrimidine-nucleoside phosphorylase|nr:thymidine phosphorylase [Spirochaetales bacterium]
MTILEIIEKKKRGESLSQAEIRFFIDGYVNDEIPDYQASAFLMAVWFAGMGEEETYELTLAMAESGDQIDLSAISGIKVDKHSTGGVADTTTLIVAPLVAACGGKVAKMSGRGLGHTGGTLDKLESIPGFDISLGMEEFVKAVNGCGLSVIGQTGHLVPADKKMYALRDVTGTVDNLSLIASSIMSKKLAAGADAIVLDVKTGSGAFMADVKSAEELARAMVDIGARSGKRTMALVTDMNQPLGLAVGNALEVLEAIEVLRGDRGGDLTAVSLSLAAQMISFSDPGLGIESAGRLALEALSSGAGLERMACMIETQHGDPKVLEDTSLLPKAGKTVPVTAPRNGFVSSIDTADIGRSALLLGAGRQKKSDVIDPAVGIWMEKRLGEPVSRGDLLAVFHVNALDNLEEAIARFRGALHITDEAPQPVKLIHSRIEDRPNEEKA